MKRGRLGLGVFASFAFGVVLVAIGCGDDDAAAGPGTEAGPDTTIEEDTSIPDTAKDTAKPVRARAILLTTTLEDAGNVNGTVDFDDLGNGEIRVKIDVSGAREGSHGVHIHENGSCKDDDAGAAGAAGRHWNPEDAGHGFPDAPSHHPGDFGNVDVPFSGVGTKTLTVKGFSIVKGQPSSAIGRSVIFHAGTDDGVTQPTGNSGARAACGVIEVR